MPWADQPGNELASTTEPRSQLTRVGERTPITSLAYLRTSHTGAGRRLEWQPAPVRPGS